MITNWQTYKIKDIGQIVAGGTPSTTEEDNFGGDIPWVTPADLSGYSQKFISHGRKSITKKGLQSSSARLVPAGSVLFSCRAPIGYVAIAKNELSTNQGFKAVVPNKDLIDSDYLYYYLMSCKSDAEAIASGTTFKEISSTNFGQLEIKVPPLEKQKEIVSKIETIFQARDNAVLQLEKSKEQLAVLKMSILNSAIRGELVPQDSSDESAQNLLHKLLLDQEKNEKNEKNEKKSKSQYLINKEEIPFDLPDGWAWCFLGNLINLLNGDRGINYPNKNEYVNEGVPWINTGHIRQDGSLSLDDMNYITKEKFESLRAGKIEPNDLVYCLRGATLGKTAFVKPFKEGAIASSLVILRPHKNSNLNPEFLYYYLISPLGREQIFKFDNGSAQPNLSAASVANYLFPLPPRKEQDRIVQNVKVALNQIKKMSEIIGRNLLNANQLKQSVLKKAFEGEL